MSGATVLTTARGMHVGPASAALGREGMVVRRCAVHHGQCPCRWFEGFPSDLLVDLQLTEGQALHVRLAYALRSAIQSGLLVSGATLPPSRVLATELGMSRSVVVTAYTNLEADGYVEARQGAGTRVRAGRRLGSSVSSAKRGYSHGGLFPLHRPAPTGAPEIRLFGGLPDPALFPRTQWLRHYRHALTEMSDCDLTYPDPRGAEALRVALAPISEGFVVSSPRRGISWSAVASLRDSRSPAGPCIDAGFVASPSRTLVSRLTDMSLPCPALRSFQFRAMPAAWTSQL